MFIFGGPCHLIFPKEQLVYSVMEKTKLSAPLISIAVSIDGYTSNFPTIRIATLSLCRVLLKYQAIMVRGEAKGEIW